jgi:tetratricopeptide (TPR) repeat protein
MIKEIEKKMFFVMGLGWYYYNLGEYERSIPFYDWFLDTAEDHPFPQLLIAHFNKLQGANYAGMGDHLRAVQYYLNANKLYYQLGDRSADYELGTSYFHLDSLEKATYYYKRYLEVAAKDGRYYSMGSSYYSLGNIASQKGKYQEAEEFFRRAFELVSWVYENKRNAESMDEDIRYNFIAHQSVGKYKEERALVLLSKIHLRLFELYEIQNLLRKALDEYILYHRTLDELNNFEQVAAIEEIINKYEADKKEQKINLLSQDKALSDLQLRQTRIMMFALGGLFFLAVFVAILFIRMIRFRSEQKAVVLEQKLLRSQMNPHFIFNALSNITNLVEKHDNASASRYLNRFARLVRHILESTREDFIMLDDELKNLENYLELQKLRLDDKFNYSITMEDNIDPEEIMVLPMLIQPFVENSIEHGIRPKEGAGRVSIRFQMHAEFITCEVEDDGIGREQSLKIESFKADHRSYGVTIARERLAAMSKKLRHSVKLSIIDLRGESGKAVGTRVIIEMPYKMAV